MRQGFAIALLLGAFALPAGAQVIEIAPDLYLMNRTSRTDTPVDMKVAAITEATRFAASQGRVAVPVSGRFMQIGPLLKNYEYQFRLMSRSEALAARPTLPDVVIGLTGDGTCAAGASPAIADLVPEMLKLEALQERGLLASEEAKEEAETPPPTEDKSTPPPGVPDPANPLPPQAGATASTQ